jgi:SOS regulatory protein LexA
MSDETYAGYKHKILNFYRNNRRMPGYKEIMKMLGFRSKNAVYKLINKLVADDVLEKDSDGHLTPMKIFGEVPLLGLVEAGIPTSVDPNTLDTFNLQDFLIKDSDKTYLLEVKGDSMIEEGILEGDMVIAERTDAACDGDIVIAEVDGGWTMKYLRYEKNGKNGRPYLMPANKNYKPIYPEYDLKIAAIVKGVIRKY